MLHKVSQTKIMASQKIARTVSISTLESLYLSASCLNTDVTLAGAGTT